MNRIAASLLLIVLAAGCGGSNQSRHVDFVQTDSAFFPDEKLGQVEVFLDRKPPWPYRSVGILDVRIDSLAVARDAAVEKAREVGCDYVIERSLHPTSRGPAPVPTWTLGYEPRPIVHVTVKTPEPTPVGHQFVCGVIAL